MWIFRLSAEKPHQPSGPEAPDFLATACGPDCLFSERAVACLRDLLAPDGEFLPVACAAGPFYVYGCRRHLAQAAHPGGAHAFRINTRGDQVFVSGDVAERILACGLTGFALEPLWLEPGAVPVGCAPGDVARLAWESGLGYLQPFVAEHLAPAIRARPRLAPCLPHLVQINLADVSAPPLPPAGLLSFCAQGDCWAVHYAEPGEHGTCAVETAPMLTLPPPDAPAVQALHLDTEDLERYRMLADAVAKSYGPGHQLLGHPAKSQELPALPGGWTLLLQLDPASTPGRQLCFWAPTSDLAERRFDRVQMKRG